MKRLVIIMLLVLPAIASAKPPACRVTLISQYKRNVWIQCNSTIYKLPQSEFSRLPRVGQRFSRASVLAEVQRQKECDVRESRRPVPDRSKP